MLQRETKQPFVVENRTGAGGNIGADFVARAKPDGYTLMFGTSGPLAINKPLYKSISYDPRTSFTPIIYVGYLPNVLVDITPVLECKHKAMACFVSQLAMQAYDRHVNALNVFRTYTLPASVLAAEGFRVCTPQEARDDPYGLMFQGHAHPALAAMRVTGGAMTFADWCRRGMRLLRRAC